MKNEHLYIRIKKGHPDTSVSKTLASNDTGVYLLKKTSQHFFRFRFLLKLYALKIVSIF